MGTIRVPSTFILFWAKKCDSYKWRGSRVWPWGRRRQRRGRAATASVAVGRLSISATRCAAHAPLSSPRATTPCPLTKPGTERRFVKKTVIKFTRFSILFGWFPRRVLSSTFIYLQVWQIRRSSTYICYILHCSKTIIQRPSSLKRSLKIRLSDCDAIH